MFKMFVSQQLRGIYYFNLKNNINWIFFRKFLVFSDHIPDSIKSVHSEKELLITAKKSKYRDSCKANLVALVLKIKMGINSGSYFCPFRFWTCKRR
jgi:hypothetical protein